ncbi:hypothetical protein JCM8115_000144 [Rhodotorula mucilaginosa]
MARAKAETATKAKTRNSKHPSKAFRKVIAPIMPEDSEGSGASSNLEDDASDTETAADDSSSCTTDASEASKELTPNVQAAVQYLQSNKVLGAIAFAYGFRKKGVARGPHKQLHYYADMFEAFIENVYEDDPPAGTEWLKTLWSSRCFPDLQSYIKEHSRNKGVPYQYSDLSGARAWWQTKRQRALSAKPV